MSDNIILFEVPNGDPVEDKLCQAHEAEAEGHRAEFYNYGQVCGENYIESKTSKGRLVTDIDPKTMEVRHRWFTYAETGGPWDLSNPSAQSGIAHTYRNCRSDDSRRLIVCVAGLVGVLKIKVASVCW